MEHKIYELKYYNEATSLRIYDYVEASSINTVFDKVNSFDASDYLYVADKRDSFLLPKNKLNEIVVDTGKNAVFLYCKLEHYGEEIVNFHKQVKEMESARIRAIEEGIKQLRKTIFSGTATFINSIVEK